MAWQRYIWGTTTHWADMPKAFGWIRQAKNLSTLSEEQRLNTRPFDEQRDATRLVWDALGNFCKALDLPWITMAPARETQLRWWSQIACATWEDTLARNLRWQWALGRVPGGPLDVQLFVIPRGEPLAISADRLRAIWASVNKSFVQRNLIQRIGLDANADRYSNCDDNVRLHIGQGGLCSFDMGFGSAVGCTYESLPGTEGCDRYDWSVCMWDTPLGDTAKVLPPLRWWFEMARSIVEQLYPLDVNAIVSDGTRYAPLETLIVDSVRWATAANLRVAAELHLIDDSALEATADNIEQTLKDLEASNLAKARELTSKVFGPTIALAGVIFPGVGTALAAAFALGEAIAELIPAGRVVATDRFGRALPVFERTTLSSRADPRIAPTHNAPDPPGYIAPPPPNTQGIPPPVSETEQADLFNTALQGYLAQGLDAQTAAFLATGDVAKAIAEREMERQQKLAEEAALQEGAVPSIGSTVAAAGASVILFGLGWLLSR